MMVQEETCKRQVFFCDTFYWTNRIVGSAVGQAFEYQG